MIALASVVWVGFLVWLVPQVWPRVDRYLQVLEDRIPEPASEKAPMEPMPVDLILQARTAYSEKWAQEQAMEHMQDVYGRTGSWDGVRQAIAAGGL